DENGVDLAALLILLAFAIKAAFPLLHTWLQDSYPKATAVGAVLLSAFTTKLAIYTLARGFAGTDILIPIGCIMTAFPVFFALIENDLRKVLAYSLNNQLGFMVCAIGIGTPLAINGASAHAFVHIIYKALLFMGMGAVLVRVGTTKATELGGLHKSMPWTTTFTIIGAMSISAFPLFSGFVAKSMITLAAAEAHMLFAYLVLLFASAGVLEHSGIKIPYFAFFAHDQFAPSNTGRNRPKEAPRPMLIAMGIAAFLCIFVGIYPPVLYGLLPYETDYHAYTAEHVATQMQLLLFAILAFMLLVRFKMYPDEIRSVNLDVDWVWRVPGYRALMGGVQTAAAVWHVLWHATQNIVAGALRWLYTTHGPAGVISKNWTVGYTALTSAAVLAVVLLGALFT
ncbi:MAG: proton-conducting transporter membrane subunit, partial [Pseudomonadota bacterium]